MIEGQQVDLAGIAERLKSADDIVICGHVSPDGDCMGSQLGLASALRALGKQVTCLLAKDEPIDFGLRFLPGTSDMVPATDFSGRIGLFVTVDVPTTGRMGDAAAKLHASAPATLTIDHHPAEVPLSQANYVDADAPAVALIIWNLIGYLGVTPDADMATCCYTGLVTDTGRFQYQNTTAAAFEAASAMMAAGVDPSVVACSVYQNRSRASLTLEEHVLANMQFFNDGACAMSWLTRKDFDDAGAVKSDAEPLIDVLRSVRGVRVACILRQQDGNVRGSLRAKDDTDVSAIAARIGGGGHRAAAGFTFEGTIEAARARIEQAFADLDAK
jgi:phosphoesterase RecJ-like protein